MTTALSDPPAKTRFVVYLVAAAYFMEMLDGTVITTALPQMARSFQVEPVALNVGITVYMVTVAVFVPLCGWLADRFGVRTIFSLAIFIFTLASVLCGFTDSLWFFVAARVLQGIGGAMMVPVGRLVVLQTTERKDLLTAIAIINWPGLTAPILGPPLGGFITDTLSWRWVFYLNLPLGIVGFVLALLLVPNLKLAVRRRLDLLGFMLSAVGISLFVYGASELGSAASAYAMPAAFVLAGLFVCVLAYWHMRRHPAPLLDFRAMRLPSYSVAVFGGSVFRLGIGSNPFLFSLMFQLAFHMSAFQSGMLVLIIFIGVLGWKPAITPLLRRYGFPRILFVSSGAMTLAYVASAFLAPGTPVAVIVAVILFGGFARSMQYTAFQTMQFSEVPPEEIGAANTVAAMLMQMTLGLGSTLGALALNASDWARGRPIGTPDLADFRNAFLIVAAISLLVLVDLMRLPPNTGQQVSGHKSG